MFKLGSLCIALCLPAALLADFSYDQVTKMSGGAMAGVMKFAGAFSKQLREPMQATVAVKGNRMVHWTRDNAQIIDLDSETITSVNFARKQYSVMTFAEMTQAMERGMQRMQSGRKSEAPAESKPADTKMDLKVDIKETGQTRQIAGYNARQVILSMKLEGTDQKTGQKGAMIVTNDMWLAPAVAGYEEIQEFHKKMAMKMAWTPGASAMAAGIGADMSRGMAGIAKEAAKMEGIPLLQVMKMTPTADGQPVTASSGAEGQAPPPQQSQAKSKPETPSLTGALAGRLGGFGGFGRKKKAAEPAKEEPKQEAAAPAAASSPGEPATLMEMTTEMSGLSRTADESKFAIPAGFKKVESELQKMR
ncbi:MAG TPA: hypothetical protein VL285_01770 [Bryobacteraceae bacterium]|nr:hypothetical protein [Bryobacteraceae bacterium]